MDLLIVFAGILFGVVILLVLIRGFVAFGSGLKEGFNTAETATKSPNRPRISKQDIEKQAWLDASTEIQSNCIDQALWAKAFAECSGDEQKQRAKYLAWRQKEIYDRLLQEAKQG